MKIPAKYKSTRCERRAQRARCYAALKKHYRLQVGFWLGLGYKIKTAQRLARADVKCLGLVASKFHCY